MTGEEPDGRTHPAGPGDLPEQLRRVHMVGIGGAGMSGLARILLARGGQVSGSDAKNSRGVVALRARGARVQIGHDPSALDQIPGGPTAVVTTHAAIPKTNPELVAARSRGLPVLLRPQVLADLMAGYRTLLVAGTHGKTSTTSMAVVALQHAHRDPSFAIGGELNESGTNAHHGSGTVFVAEADESDGSLLQYTPDVVVLTNIEADHLDFFGTVEAYVRTFDEFVGLIAPGGALVVCVDDPGAADLARRCAPALAARGISVYGYGSAGAGDDTPGYDTPGDDTGGDGAAGDDSATDNAGGEAIPGVTRVATITSWTPRPGGAVARVRFAPPLVPDHTVSEPREPTGEASETAAADYAIELTLPGIHMARNAVGAIVGAVCAGADLPGAVAGIESFGGVRRRFELTGTAGGVTVYDDYAHHPTEVAAVLTAARAMVEAGATEAAAGSPTGRVIAVFQPHLYSRTADFAADFAAALDLADQVVVADVYGAREEPIPGVSGRTIADQVRVPAAFVADLSALAGRVAEIAEPGDLVLTLGAGDITMQGAEILAALAGRAAGRPSPPATALPEPGERG